MYLCWGCLDFCVYVGVCWCLLLCVDVAADVSCYVVVYGYGCVSILTDA